MRKSSTLWPLTATAALMLGGCPETGGGGVSTGDSGVGGGSASGGSNGGNTGGAVVSGGTVGGTSGGATGGEVGGTTGGTAGGSAGGFGGGNGGEMPGGSGPGGAVPGGSGGFGGSGGSGPCVPSPEDCNNVDDDCDGLVDNANPEGAALTLPCYDGADGTAGIGPCLEGLTTCRAGEWLACEGQVLPSVELCDGQDTDCNGLVDDTGVGCETLCTPGETSNCYTGPQGSQNMGRCHGGTQTCSADGLSFGACVGEVVPSVETCDGTDNDCNGVLDDADGAGVVCAVGVGQCAGNGRTLCDVETGEFVCDGVALQGGREACNRLDDDCDGTSDEDFADAIGQACSVGVGACAAPGLTDCNAGGAPVAGGPAAAPLSFSGIRQNVAPADLVAGGFRQCWRDTYSSTASLVTVLEDCAGAELLLACGRIGQPELSLAAMGDRAQILLDTGLPLVEGSPEFSNLGHEHNGVKWYFNPSYSWGFAPAGEATNLYSCDYDDGTQSQSDLRMCWHTDGGSITEGYRCGDTGGEGGADWERVLYARANAPIVCEGVAGVPTPESCNGIDDDCDGRTDEEPVGVALQFPDRDGDGFGDPDAGVAACAPIPGFIADGTDCADGDARTHPGATEACNGNDDDCDGRVDDDFADQLGQRCVVGEGQCAAAGVTVCNPNAGNGAGDGFLFGGVQQNIAEAALTDSGFRQCWRGTYDGASSIAAALAGCQGGELLMACRPVGSPTFTLAATGDPAEITLDTGVPEEGGGDGPILPAGLPPVSGTNLGHDHNGVKWYFNSSYSWGFAPAGTETNLSSCDYNNGEQFVPDRRMCWHTGDGNITNGYRCGDNDLNGDNTWERVLFVRDEGPVICDAVPAQPEPELCNTLDDDCDGIVDEDFSNLGSECTSGLGVCEQGGTYVCAADGESEVCDAVPLPGAVESCDGADNDCDGAVDNGFNVGEACSPGVGACQRFGEFQCAPQGGTACSVVAAPPGVEVCNGVDDDCDGQVDEENVCLAAVRPNVLRCGSSQRDVTPFLPAGRNLQLLASCIPDANTQAMLVSRDGVTDGRGLQAYLNAGGIVITEFSSSAPVFNQVFGTNVAQGAFSGDCYDSVMPGVQFNANLPFWQNNAFAAPPAGRQGCGYDMTAYPGITRLGGWSQATTSLAFRDLGQGRVWLVEADWQDVDSPGNQDNTYALMAYMILHNAAAGVAPPFVGIQRDLPVADVLRRGYRECHRDAYSNGATTLAAIQAGCGGAELMMACRPTGNATLTVAAAAPRADVLFDVGQGQGAIHNSNGVDWYYDEAWSWGFAAPGTGVTRFTCDTANVQPESRLCWHTGNGNINPGWRCGVATGLGGDGSYERIVYAR